MANKEENVHIQKENHPSYGGIDSGANDENNVKDPVDLLEATIGGFGRWQCQLSILVSILKIPISWIQLSILFLAPPTEFWCAPPKKFKSLSTRKWIDLISSGSNVTGKLHICQMPNVLNSRNTSIVPCQWGYEYNTTQVHSSIITEWDLVCDRKILADIAQTILMFGILVGLSIFGPAADQYGRRKTLLLSTFLLVVFGILSTLSPFYSLFMVLRFILAVVSSGVMVTSFVFCVEIVAGSWRTTVPILHQIPFGLGNSIMAVMAYYIRDWRHLQLILCGISALYLCYYWLIPESPRWLMAVGRKEEAIVILQNAAQMNGIDKTKIRKKVNELNFIDDECVDNKISLITVFKTSELKRRSIYLCLKWFCNGVVFYGFYQYAGQLNDNMYLTIGIIGLISIPGGIIGAIIVKKLGRKVSIAAANYLTAVCIFSIIFIPQGVYYQDWPIILLAAGGIFGLTISSPALHLFTGELYPTIMRNAALGLNIMLTKLGAMIAPLLIGLSSISPIIPMASFAALSLVEAILVHPLPETIDTILPETVGDIEDDKASLISH